VLFLREGGLLKVGAQAGYTDLPESFEPSRGITGRAFRTGIPAFVPDVGADPDHVEGDPLVTSEIAVPLAAEGVTLGVLSIESIADTPLTLADFQLAEAVAERLSVALLLGREQQALAERARLFAALTNFAKTALQARPGASPAGGRDHVRPRSLRSLSTSSTDTRQVTSSSGRSPESS
jgi:GAF domain-containing protein